MRLVTACWYAMTGFIASLFSFLVSSWKFNSIGSRVFVGFVIVPTVVFALCGATMGSRTLHSVKGTSSARVAMGSGGAVAATSLVLFIFGWAAVEVLRAENPGLLLFAGMAFYLMALWGSIRLVPFILIGIVSGWLLHLLKPRFMNALG